MRGNRAGQHDVVLQLVEERGEEPYSASEVAALGLDDGPEGGEVGDLGRGSGEAPEHPRRLRFSHGRRKIEARRRRLWLWATGPGPHGHVGGGGGGG